MANRTVVIAAEPVKAAFLCTGIMRRFSEGCWVREPDKFLSFVPIARAPWWLLTSRDFASKDPDGQMGRC